MNLHSCIRLRRCSPSLGDQHFDALFAASPPDTDEAVLGGWKAYAIAADSVPGLRLAMHCFLAPI